MATNNVNATPNSVQAPPAPPTTEGTLELIQRPKGAPFFKVSALNKSRLRLCIFLHFLMFLVMCAKLLEDILDRLDIFILELEELYIPKPLIWEWIWFAGVIFAFVGLTGIRRNRMSSMKIYVVGTFLFGVCPLIGGAVYFFNDIYEYVDTRETTNLEMWQGYPVALLWYIFLTIGVQVHLFSLFFAIKLILLWKGRTKKVN